MYDRNNLADVHIQQRVVSPLNNYLVSMLCHCYQQQRRQATTKAAVAAAATVARTNRIAQ